MATHRQQGFKLKALMTNDNISPALPPFSLLNHVLNITPQAMRWLLKPTAVLIPSLLIACSSTPITTLVNNPKTTESQTPISNSLLERALGVSAADLASSYYTVKRLVDMLPLAEQGGVIKVPGGSIGKDNVKKARVVLEGRLSTYATAINKRGYKSIAGTYIGNASASCTDLPSSWIRNMLTGKLSTLNISQNGFSVQIEQQVKYGSDTLKIPAIIVESSLALSDPENSDFGFLGEATRDEITIRPNVNEILATWPFWIKPLNRAALSSCRILLAPGQSIVPLTR